MGSQVISKQCMTQKNSVKERNTVHSEEKWHYFVLHAHSRQGKADKINRAYVIAEGEQVFGFRFCDHFSIVELGCHNGSHRKTAQKPCYNCIETVSVYSKKRSEKRFYKFDEGIRQIHTNHDSGQHHKRKQCRNHFLKPESKPVTCIQKALRRVQKYNYRENKDSSGGKKQIRIFSQNSGSFLILCYYNIYEN